jgi:hypothetical protein
VVVKWFLALLIGIGKVFFFILFLSSFQFYERSLMMY